MSGLTSDTRNKGILENSGVHAQKYPQILGIQISTQRNQNMLLSLPQQYVFLACLTPTHQTQVKCTQLSQYEDDNVQYSTVPD